MLQQEGVLHARRLGGQRSEQVGRVGSREQQDTCTGLPVSCCRRGGSRLDKPPAPSSRCWQPCLRVVGLREIQLGPLASCVQRSAVVAPCGILSRLIGAQVALETLPSRIFNPDVCLEACALVNCHTDLQPKGEAVPMRARRDKGMTSSRPAVERMA
jgi:hypothetical protein